MPKAKAKKIVKKAKGVSKKKVVKKEVKKTPALTAKKEVGKVTHFYGNVNVGVIALTDTLKEGDMISIEGATTNVKQKVGSMQLNHKPIKVASKGQEVGLKVNGRVREHDIVYKV